jgi:hypothetical protein
MLRCATGPHPSGPQGPRTERWDEDDAFIAGWSDTDWLPDLTDPATLGCLLVLVREAWGDPHVYVLSCASDWFTVCSPNAEGGKWLAHPPIDGSTEAEALIAALEAAP